MRRWVCIIALLAGFSSDDYLRGARLRDPVAIERLIGTGRLDERRPAQTGAWWARPSG